MNQITQTLPFRLFVLAVASVTLVMPFMAQAAVYLSPFTPTELGNWSADRAFPSGGVQSLSSFAGRTDVLEIGIDKDLRSNNISFYYTEGIQKQISPTTELGADLYVDSDWADKDVRAGLWGVASDGDTITAYPIIEFSTARSDDTTGWRYWTNAGWQNIDASYTYDTWASLSMVIEEDAIKFMIDGEEIGEMALDGTEQFDAVILNAYNYGTEADSYKVHWHAGLPDLAAKSQCMDGGYATYGFSNQGQCVRFVETGKDSR